VTDRDDQIDRWKATERDLRAALAATGLAPTAALQVEEYLDHNELGLAFEALVFDLDQQRPGVPPETLSRLRSAVERMGASAFDADCLDAWERIQGHSPS
jgi:hypothetical protein